MPRSLSQASDGVWRISSRRFATEAARLHPFFGRVADVSSVPRKRRVRFHCWTRHPACSFRRGRDALSRGYCVRGGPFCCAGRYRGAAQRYGVGGSRVSRGRDARFVVKYCTGNVLYRPPPRFQGLILPQPTHARQSVLPAAGVSVFHIRLSLGESCCRALQVVGVEKHFLDAGAEQGCKPLDIAVFSDAPRFFPCALRLLH